MLLYAFVTEMISPWRQRLKKELMIRSSHRRWCVKKDVLINLTKFTRKDLCQSLACNKVTGLSLETLLKKKLCQDIRRTPPGDSFLMIIQ